MVSCRCFLFDIHFDYSLMNNKFAEWLDRERGRATDLSRRLNIGRSTPSNVKSERIPMPTHWFPVVVKMSKGELTFKDLTIWRNSVLERMRDGRATKRAQQ